MVLDDFFFFFELSVRWFHIYNVWFYILIYVVEYVVHAKKNVSPNVAIAIKKFNWSGKKNGAIRLINWWWGRIVGGGWNESNIMQYY